MLRATADCAHPFSKFSTGNLETLRGCDGDARPPRPSSNAGILSRKKTSLSLSLSLSLTVSLSLSLIFSLFWKNTTQVRERLLAFKRERYCAGAMTVALVSRRSLAELEALCVATFGPIESGVQIPRPVLSRTSEGPYPVAARARVVHRLPLRDLRSLRVLWPLSRPARAEYRVGAHRLLTHLLGHEGPRSALCCLKTRGLASSLSASVALSFADSACLAVNVELANDGDGAQALDVVLPVLMEYVGCLKKDLASRAERERLWRELAGVAEAGLDFGHSKASPYSLATQLAVSLQLYAPEDVPSTHASPLEEFVCVSSLSREYSNPATNKGSRERVGPIRTCDRSSRATTARSIPKTGPTRTT